MKLKMLAFFLASVPAVALAQAPGKTIAIVNGEVITDSQVQEAAARELQSLDARKIQFDAEHTRNRHAAVEKALNAILEEKLITAEAAKRGVSKEELVTSEIESKVEVPTDAAVKTFYDSNKARINSSLEDVTPQIREYLLNQQKDQVFASFIARLKSEYKVEYFLEPLRVELETEGHPSIGPQDAPVTIVEFSDFECPFCANLFPTIKLVETNYANKVRLVYRQFPLTTIHPRAQKAAEASLCAHDQQRFWEYHDALFQDQKNLEIDGLKQKAAQLHLDEAAFSACLESGKHAEAVKKDIDAGVKAGITGTPATFINGRFLNGAVPYADFVKIIEEELQKKSVKD
jgi:protein-disulfide isomerase